jgi:hypothetical protein
MKQIVEKIRFLVLMIVIALTLIGCSPVRMAHAVGNPMGDVAAQAPAPADPSFAEPMPDIVADREAQAQRILASTVRLEFHGPGDIGHATVVGGRYLITHNHYSLSGEALSRGGDGHISAISVLKANGDVILLKAPTSYFSVAFIAPESLVLDFFDYNGVGFFDSVGVPSVESVPLAGLNIRPGSEVAQIDWNMSEALVIWTRVAAIHKGGDTPFVELDSFVEQGASGGGVFFNGVHIANNWSRNTDRQAETGEVLRQYSLAALNTENITALHSGVSEIASAGN